MAKTSKMFHPNQLDALQKVFPRHEISPADNLQDVFFRAGQESVIQHIARNTANLQEHNYQPTAQEG